MTSSPQSATLLTTPASNQLDSWAASLGFLSAEVAPGIERLAKRLALVMDEQHTPIAGEREPNGYAGISRRGDLKRMLLSDWALSDIEPDEFMRRLVSSELSYLDIERVEPRPPGQVAVLFDSGPRQAGAPRMAHLAGLVVLERRARANHVQLMTGHLSNDAVTWHSGALTELFELWLASRSARRPVQADVDRWVEELEPDTTLWVFGAEGLVVDQPGVKVERLCTRELAWGPNGATTIEVAASERTIVLDLPDRATSLRILRGRGLRRASDGAGDVFDGSLRFPNFHGAARRLLCRTNRDDELAWFSIPMSREEPARKAKRRRFTGRILAASVFGARTVAMVVDGDVVAFEVVGKSLGNVAEMEFDVADLDLDDAKVDELCSTGLAPLFFLSGKMVTLLDGTCWLFERDRSPQRADSVYSCLATNTLDQPLVLQGYGLRRWVGSSLINIDDAERRTILGPAGVHATESAPGVWVSGESRVEIDPDARLVGLTKLNGETTLVEHSSGGQLIRLHGSEGTTTLTKYSGDVASVSLHPTLPIVAIERSDHTILVVDLESKELLHRIRGGDAL